MESYEDRIRILLDFRLNLCLLCKMNSISLNIARIYRLSNMTKNTLEKQTRKQRAVAPVIATLLMVAIAVVGGTIIFVFAQGFFTQSQISGTPTIESVKIAGYDSRDVANLKNHAGIDMITTGLSPGVGNGIPEEGEYIGVYLKNDSVQKLQFAEIRFGGVVYNYTAGAAPNTPAEYAVLLKSDGTDTFVTEGQAEIQPGQTATLVMALDGDFKVGRDTQFKLTTTNGAVFVGTVVIGQQSG